MARINNLTNFVTDVANAIKTKSEITRKITPSEFDTLINEIETGSDVSGVTATAGDVRETKTFVNSNGEEVQGTFPDATAVYEEISDSSAINKDRLSLDSATSNVYNACYFDNTWYQVDGSNLIIKNSLKTKTVALSYDSSNRCFISVGCKDYFGENTLIIAIGGYWASGDKISMYLYNYETNTLTLKYYADKRCMEC